VSAGLVGFLVIVALIVGSVLLFRSMAKHMRRVPDRFDGPGDDGPGDDARDSQSSGRD